MDRFAPFNLCEKSISDLNQSPHSCQFNEYTGHKSAFTDRSQYNFGKFSMFVSRTGSGQGGLGNKFTFFDRMNGCDAGFYGANGQVIWLEIRETKEADVSHEVIVAEYSGATLAIKRIWPEEGDILRHKNVAEYHIYEFCSDYYLFYISVHGTGYCRQCDDGIKRRICPHRPCPHCGGSSSNYFCEHYRCSKCGARYNAHCNHNQYDKPANVYYIYDRKFSEIAKIEGMGRIRCTCRADHGIIIFNKPEGNGQYYYDWRGKYRIHEGQFHRWIAKDEAIGLHDYELTFMERDKDKIFWYKFSKNAKDGQGIFCAICFKNMPKPEVALVPCGDARLCKACADEVKKQGQNCPTCRGKITWVMPLFMG